MKIFNYSNYVKTFEEGLEKKNMTEMTEKLFTPIIDGKVVQVYNTKGEFYLIDSKTAKSWCDGIRDIPKPIKKAIKNEKLIEYVKTYFESKIVNGYISPFKAATMYEKMAGLVNDSNLHSSTKQELIGYYESENYSLFLSVAFLYAISQDNKSKDISSEKEEVENNIILLNEIIKSLPPKPYPIEPPQEIATEEFVYVEELFNVYSEKSNEKCTCEEDLDKHLPLKRNFIAQRKNYYSAETVRRGLRDTMIEGEIDSFENLKDEIYDGVVDVRDREYDLAYDRLNAVMSHATTISTSYNLNQKLLGWIGPAEKKGVCHMLVNDHRLRWMEDEDDE